jgi:hypothetical protein
MHAQERKFSFFTKSHSLGLDSKYYKVYLLCERSRVGRAVLFTLPTHGREVDTIALARSHFTSSGRYRSLCREVAEAALPATGARFTPSGSGLRFGTSRGEFPLIDAASLSD